MKKVRWKKNQFKFGKNWIPESHRTEVFQLFRPCLSFVFLYQNAFKIIYLCTQIVYKWHLVDKNINWKLIHSKPQTLCALNWFWHPEQGLKTNDVVHDQVPTKTTQGRGETGVLGGQGMGPGVSAELGVNPEVWS